MDVVIRILKHQLTEEASPALALEENVKEASKFSHLVTTHLPELAEYLKIKVIFVRL